MGNAQGNYQCPACGGYDIDQRWGEFSNATSLKCRTCSYIFMDSRNAETIINSSGTSFNSGSAPVKPMKQVNPLVQMGMNSGVRNNAGLEAMGGFFESYQQARQERTMRAQGHASQVLHGFMDHWGSISNRLTEIGLKLTENLNLDKEFFFFHNELWEHFDQMLNIAQNRLQNSGNEKEVKQLISELEQSNIIQLAEKNLQVAEIVGQALKFAQPFIELWYGDSETFPLSLSPEFVSHVHAAKDVIDETGEMDEELFEMFEEWENSGAAAFLIAETIEYQLENLVEEVREFGQLNVELMDLIADAQELLSRIITNHEETSRNLLQYIKEISEENS